MFHSVSPTARIAILADCDNVSPEVLAYALDLVPKTACVVRRQAYGNDVTMTHQRWRDTINQLAFTPLHQFGTSKNASDIALALDAFEILLEERADTFYLLTSDADFSALCRKLRARGAVVFGIGEAKTPAVLSKACDAFAVFPPAALAGPAQPAAAVPAVPATPQVPTKREVQMLNDAVAALAAAAPDGLVGFQPLGQRLRTDYGFSAKARHGSLARMLEHCPDLQVEQGDGFAMVRLKSGAHKPASVTQIRPAIG